MRCLALLTALLFIAPALANNVPKLNALTPKEIAEGWILLFDGETTFGWQIDGEVQVKDGAFEIGGDKLTTVRWSTPFRDFDLKLLCSGSARLFFKANGNSGSLALSP